MKILNIKLFGFLFLGQLFFSCNEEALLNEKPLDFLTAGNAYVTFNDFENGLNDLYAKYRYLHCFGEQSKSSLYGTDILIDARLSNSTNRFGNYSVSLSPTSGIVSWHWDRLYKIVSNSNTLIDRVMESGLEEDERILIEAEARFFRAFAYRSLVHYFGGVPLLLTEVREPKTDFVRETKENVLLQMEEDFSFAANNLSGITEVIDGRLSNLTAYHFLAETQIALGKYSQAISNASIVIDDPNTGLMISRFGTRTGEPGDVYWDLFRRGNQNRSSGNTEALWVGQMETDIPGGFLTTSSFTHILERQHVPVIQSLNDPDGNSAFYPQRSDANQGGRGVSLMQPTQYMENEIWASDFDNDIRNSPFNYVRDVFYDLPTSAYFGMSAKDFRGSVINSSTWRWYPWMTKVTTPGNHPDNLYMDKDLGILTTSAGSTYTDWYYLRLAETYLLRAEAYLGDGNTASAALDINVIRSRSGANPVADLDVNIDYILDERARELCFEENRRVTLQRLGRLVERVRLYNPHNADEIEDHHEVWPIPLADIEANTGVVLVQNPGY